MTASSYHDATAVSGRRVLAALIDLAIYLAASWLVFAAMAERIGGAVGAAGCTDYQDAEGGLNLCAGFNDEIHVVHDARAVAYLLAILVIWFAYHGVLQGLLGGTPGKLLTGLRVVGRDGAPAGIARCLIRSATLGIGWVVFGVGFLIAALVGAVLILGGRDHQRVGDRWAKTYVIRTRDLGKPPSRAAAPGADRYAQGTIPPPPPPPPVTDR
ncbi:MAG: RDD family protein [Thermoleophilia bacterium]|nr:RDD family protein [Thermoleophilia bacterium]